MQQDIPKQPRVYRSRIDASGRLVLPAGSRLREKLKDGDTVLVEEDEHGMHLRTIDDVVREAQAYFRSVIPAGVSLVDELIEERRAEAARE